MPFIQNSKYNPKTIHRNGHISTIYSGRIKKFPPPNYTRVKHELEDGDFLNIDFVFKDPKKALILFHGLEGDSKRTYNNSAADFFLNKDFSVFAWNNRSCGGEMNRLPRMYHHGVVSDVEEIIKFVLDKGFEEIYLMGFSMGAAQILNYLGSELEIPKEIKAAAVYSAPIKLKSSAESLKRGFNRVYLNVFTRKLKVKFKEKALQFPDLIDVDRIPTIKTFDEVDEYFTAPLHGFTNREDYYEKASPNYVIDKIKTPVLVVNAWDDPFLGEECYPIEFAKKHKYVYLETPKYGGHCAFPMRNSNYSWMDFRAYEFFNSEITSKGF